VPEGVWRLERGKLVATDSRWLAALGVIAPLWDGAAAYAISFATIALPVIGLWLFRKPRSGAGQVLLVLAVILTGFYALMWLFTVAMQLHLLLHAVVLASLAGSGVLTLLYWSALRAGIQATTLLRAARIAIAIAGVACAVGFVMIAWWIRSGIQRNIGNVTYEQPQIGAPLAYAQLTRRNQVLTEVSVKVAPGVMLADVIDMGLFDGFDPRMTREAAEERLGPIAGRWDDPLYKLRAVYYERPGGRVSLVRQGASACRSWDIHRSAVRRRSFAIGG
jgi:hypothetical protein